MTSCGETSLEMQGGSIIKIVITHVSDDGLGEFNVSGPVPDL